MADVFISYHAPSAGDIARRIADALENVGISCWYAERYSLYGLYAEDIVQEIRRCKVFLLILNEEANRSHHVKSELNLAFRYANNKNLEILSFRVDNCALDDDLMYYLAVFITVNGNPPDSQHIQDLTKRIANLLGRQITQKAAGRRKMPIFNLWTALRRRLGKFR